jgi:hypothetical protein
VLSVAVLGIGYGIAAKQWGWFPAPQAERAWRQARWTILKEPSPHRTSKVYERQGVRSINPADAQPGLTFISSASEGPEGLKGGFRLIDEKGNVLHEWQFDRMEFFPNAPAQRRGPKNTRQHGSYLLPNGDVLFNLNQVGAVRLNSCGKVKWTMSEGNHHSVAQGSGETFWMSAVSQASRSGSERYPNGFPGLGSSVWLDRLLQVSGDGQVLQDIPVLDVLYENGLERFLFKYGRRSGDATHLNDVEPLGSSMANQYPLFDEGDLLVSLRNINLVFVFDPESLEVKWHATGPFIQQHDPDYIGDGWIGIFDNNRDETGRGSVLGGSRIVFVQPHTDSVEVRFPTQHSEPYYTEKRGKWQMLENGNMLLVESEAGRLLEVGPDGRTVWEWVSEPYDNSTVPLVMKATRVDLTREQVASWPCSSVDSVSTSAQNQQTAQ